MEKMLLIQQDISFNDKEKANLKYDSQKFKLLVILMKEFYPGPFSSVEDVQNYMNNTPNLSVFEINRSSFSIER